MIEAITKIPKDVLKGQLREIEENLVDNKTQFILFKLDENLELDFDENFRRGKFSDLEKTFNISKKQKELILNYKKYIDDNTKSYGTREGLLSCSPLHFKFTDKVLDFDKNTKSKNNDNKGKYRYEIYINEFKKDKFYDNKIKDKISLNIENVFYKIVNKEIEVKKNEVLIFLLPDDFINDFKDFFKNYLNFKYKEIKFSKDYLLKEEKSSLKDCSENNCVDNKICNFNLDVFESYQDKHRLIYNKLNNKIIKYNDSLITKEDYEKIELFKKIIEYKKIYYLPIPSFKLENYKNKQIFEKVSLLQKLKNIYKTEEKPFNYYLISRESNKNYRFEKITNFHFIIDEMINEDIYNLRLNSYKEGKINLKNKVHDKYELLFDMLFLFFNCKDEVESVDKLLSFLFNPEVYTRNSFVKQILNENATSVINLIFKEKKDFINFRLLKLINKILNNILKVEELQNRFKFTNQIRRLLLIAFKYETIEYESKKVKMAKEFLEIEEKFDKFRETEEISKIENIIEGYYYFGIVFKILLSKTSSGKSSLELLSKYLISTSTVKQLKDKMILLSSKYAHNLGVNPKMWNRLNEILLKYDFKNGENVKDNLIPLFAGFYSSDYVSKKKEEK